MWLAGFLITFKFTLLLFRPYSYKIFHFLQFFSTAEENVLFVALERIEAVKLPRSFHKEHLLEEEQFLEAGKILEEVFLKAQRSENNEAKALFSQLSGIIQKILKSFCGHISTEEQMVKKNPKTKLFPSFSH